MIVRKALLAACAAALMAAPAWALPGRAPDNRGTGHAPATTPVGPPATRPARGANPGADERSPRAQEHGVPQGQGESPGGGRGGSGGSAPEQSRRCAPHRVAYVAAGRLVSHTLVLDGSEQTPTVAVAARDGPGRPTYSGDVTIAVERTNRHARPDKGTTKTYTLDHATVLLRLSDQNDDGSVDLADAVPGSRAKVIGKVTKLAPRCDQAGFTPELKIRKLLVHAPKPPTS